MANRDNDENACPLCGWVEEAAPTWRPLCRFVVNGILGHRHHQHRLRAAPVRPEVGNVSSSSGDDTLPQRPRVSTQPEMTTEHQNYAVKELKTANEVVEAVTSLWREPPTPSERMEHSNIVQSLPQKQKKAVECLEDIFRHVKGGEFLMSQGSQTESHLELMPFLMTNEWFNPSDLRTAQIPVPRNLMLDNNSSREEMERQLLLKSAELQESLVKALNIDASKVSVKPPHVSGPSFNLTVTGLFEVSVNGKNEVLPEEIVINNPMNVSLKRVEDARKNQIPVFKLKPSDFDSRGDFEFPCSGGDIQRRGGMEYKQPSSEWVRVGLSVKGKYDNGNDDWLMMNGNPGEWAVGFHGSSTPDRNRGIASSREIRPGDRQRCSGYIDINELSDNKGKPCGTGSYFADDIETSSGYSTKLEGRVCVFQARLRPSKIRIPKEAPGFRILNEAEHARPYGICIKVNNDDKDSFSRLSTVPSRRNVGSLNARTMTNGPTTNGPMTSRPMTSRPMTSRPMTSQQMSSSAPVNQQCSSNSQSGNSAQNNSSDCTIL